MRQTLLLHHLPEELLRPLADRLERAGGGSASTVEWMAFAGAAAGLTAAQLLAAAGPTAAMGVSPLGLSIVLTLAGAAGLPAYWLARRIDAHRARMARQLPQVLDLLVVALESGHSLDSAMQQVTRAFRGPLVDELEQVLARVLEGVSLTSALDAAAERSGLADLAAITSAVAAARQMGTPLAKNLRSQAGQIRQRRAQAAEEAARKAGVKILLPLACCIFPVMLVLLLGPAAIGIFSAFSRLNLPK